ncbi:MAG: hypothetical protein IJ403_04045 [Oscillospiraceae bacterium]|nr:hypothetical protein [Oscillospiraceae bacterium]
MRNTKKKHKYALSAFTHNPEVVGSSPASATKKNTTHPGGVLFGYDSILCSYHLRVIESDERSSLGRKGLALPAADAARPFRVQRSTDAKERRRRRQMSDTANRGDTQN